MVSNQNETTNNQNTDTVENTSNSNSSDNTTTQSQQPQPTEETETGTERQENQTTPVQPQPEQNIKGNQAEGANGLLAKSEDERQAKSTDTQISDGQFQSTSLNFETTNTQQTQFEYNVNGTILVISIAPKQTQPEEPTDPEEPKPKEYEEIKLASNKISSNSVDGKNIPANVADGSPDTRFSGKATESQPCELRIELDNTEPLSKFEIDFYRDEIRKEKYAISLSSDLGKTWYSTDNIILKEDVHTVELKQPVKITNFKILGYGNVKDGGTKDYWLSVTGLRLYKVKGAPSEPLPSKPTEPTEPTEPVPNTGTDLAGFKKIYPDSKRQTAPKEWALGIGDYRKRLDERAVLGNDRGNVLLIQKGKTRVNITASPNYKPLSEDFKQGDAMNRGYMVTEDEWRDCEVTEIFNGAFGGDDKTTYWRTEKHTGSNDQRGSAYKFSFSSKGVRVGKEQYHVAYDYHKDGWVKKSGFPSFEGNDVTVKTVMYNSKDGKSVILEVWVEKTFGKQDFALYHRWVDDGTYWGGDEDIGGRKAREPILYSGCFVTCRTDAGNVTVKKLDIREISVE